MTRTGKIARLPKAIRDELNQRLRDGEPHTTLAEWLNSLPETKALLEKFFRGRAISEQNMSEWKAGGYAEWELHEEMMLRVEAVEERAGEVSDSTAGQPGDQLAFLLSGYYMAALGDWDGEDSTFPAKRLRLLRSLTHDLTELRRSDHSAWRIDLARDKFKFLKAVSERGYEKEFQEWLKNPEIRARLVAEAKEREEKFQAGMKEVRMRLFGMAP